MQGKAKSAKQVRCAPVARLMTKHSVSRYPTSASPSVSWYLGILRLPRDRFPGISVSYVCLAIGFLVSRYLAFASPSLYLQCLVASMACDGMRTQVPASNARLCRAGCRCLRVGLQDDESSRKTIHGVLQWIVAVGDFGFLF